MGTLFEGVALDFGATDLVFASNVVSGVSGPSSATVSGLGSMIVSDFEVEKMAKVEPTLDAGGNTVNRTYYDKQWKCTWRGVVKGSGLANALIQSNLPEIGTLATAASTNYAWLNLLVFTIEKAVVKKSNTKNAVVEFELLYSPNITAAASA